MSRHTRLSRRGSTYYFRCKIPVDLTEYYSPKREIVFSLRTKDHREALLKVKVASLKQDQEFDSIRRQISSKPKTTLSNEEINHLALLRVYEALDFDEHMRATGGIADWYDLNEAGLEEVEYEERDALAHGKTESVEHLVDSALAYNNIKLSKQSRDYKKLAYAFLKAAVKINQLVKQRQQGHLVETPAPPAPLTVTLGDETSLSMSALFERWKTEKRAAGTTSKSIEDFGVQVRRFSELHGDIPVKTVTKAHIRDFKDAMLKLPARLQPGTQGMTVPQLLEYVEASPHLPRLSPKTVNEKALGAVRAILQWAMVNGYLDDNPAAGVKVQGGKVIKNTRLPYSVDDLNAIFRFPVFSQDERPIAGAGEAAKWLPLLALFTGARLDELGQLHIRDIQVSEGIHYIDLNTEEGKSVKTNASKRKVPIHPELVELGFLRYVNEQRKTGSRRLFPLLQSSSKVTAAWSKWWGRYARQHGITDKRKVFHSFRHTAKDGFRNCGVSKPLFDALQGHAATDVSDTYGRGYNLPTLAEAMSKLQYPGLDIDYLKN